MDKILYGSNSIEWETPHHIFTWLDSLFQFELDAAATAENALCNGYLSKEMDAFTLPWLASSVFLNPPYGKGNSGLWVQRAAQQSQQRLSTVICLIPARTDTSWWHEVVQYAAGLWFIRGRIKFRLGGVEHDAATFPSAVVIFNNNPNVQIQSLAWVTLEKLMESHAELDLVNKLIEDEQRESLSSQTSKCKHCESELIASIITWVGCWYQCQNCKYMFMSKGYEIRNVSTDLAFSINTFFAVFVRVFPPKE